jgi:hypothetical protein
MSVELRGERVVLRALAGRLPQRSFRGALSVVDERWMLLAEE